MQYHNQKTRSRIRNIEWQFTYDTWIEWWGDDIENRGSKSGQLVMSRFNDSGPYHPDNVRKATVNENAVEARKLKPFTGHTEETRAKMRAYQAQKRLENTI